MYDLQHNSAIQSLRNRESRGAWDGFAGHRQRLMQLLASLVGTLGSPRSQRIVILGAGNCNDLDLRRLADWFHEIRLVDLDREAVQAGIQRQMLPSHVQVVVQAPVDISGLGSAPLASHATPVAALSNRPSSDAPLAEVVLSSCVFSQIVEAAVGTLAGSGGEEVDLRAEDTQLAASLLPLLDGLRRRHIGMMLDQLAPGGLGLFVSDFCSSRTWPALPQVPAEQFRAAAAEQLRQRNFFTGLNPLIWRQLLQSDVELKSRVQGVKLIEPWRWQLGATTFAVFALQFQRRHS